MKAFLNNVATLNEVDTVHTCFPMTKKGKCSDIPIIIQVELYMNKCCLYENIDIGEGYM